MDWISPRQLNRLGMLNMNRRNVDYIARYNDRSSYPLVDNKLQTKLVVAEYGVKTPELLQIVRQQHEISHFREMAEDLGGFAIKPANGSGGKGITVITGRDDDAVADGHEAPDPLEQAAADARFPREELRAAAARLGREAEARDGGRA